MGCLRRGPTAFRPIKMRSLTIPLLTNENPWIGDCFEQSIINISSFKILLSLEF